MSRTPDGKFACGCGPGPREGDEARAVAVCAEKAEVQSNASPIMNARLSEPRPESGNKPSSLMGMRAARAAVVYSPNHPLLVRGRAPVASGFAVRTERKTETAGSTVLMNYSGDAGLVGGVDGTHFRPRALDPAVFGPNTTCEREHDFSRFVFGVKQWFKCKLYVPGSLIGNVCVATNSSPLVAVMHADKTFTTSDCLMYDLLGRHLASHGYIVSVIARFTRTDGQAQWKQLPNEHEWLFVDAHLDWLYTESSVKTKLLSKIAVVGHSAGGSTVLQHLTAFSSKKPVFDLILLAPAFSWDHLPPFAGNTVGFLGMNISHDTDGAAGGLAWTIPPPLKMGTALGVFDKVPHQAVQKDAIYFGQGDHYFQNALVARAYITAHLGLHLKGIIAYGDIFRLQQPPGSLLEKSTPAYLVQMHNQAANKLRLVDFDVNTPPFLTSGGVSGAVTGEAYKLNRWATPVGRVLWFKWKSSPFPTAIRINWNAKILPLNFNFWPFECAKSTTKTKATALAQRGRSWSR